MEKTIDPKYLKNLIRRRKTSIFFIVIFFSFVGLAVAIYLPPVYMSEATIRVEEQEIPENFVQPTVREYAEERINKISQQILSRSNLKDIANEFSLFSDDEDPHAADKVAAKLREKIRIQTIVSEMESKPGGRNLSFTVAFNLAFSGDNPETVQKVTDKLSNLFIEEDVKSTEKVITATTEFLKSELERFENEINIHENKVSEFKEKHIGELPSDLPGNLRILAGLERDLDNSKNKLRRLKEQKLFLESKLKKVEPLTPIVVEGQRISTNPNERLKELNIQLTKLRSIYSEKHPDVKKVKREISELEEQVNVSDDSVMKIKRLNQLENQLAVAERELGPGHPDVRALKKEIALLTKDVNNVITEKAKVKISEEKPDNPSYIALETQLSAANLEIDSIEEDILKIEEAIKDYQGRISRTPSIEKELNLLTRDYESAKNKYHEIYNELMSVRVAQKIEGEKRGRRFTIASPAYFPTKPYKPNRLAIIALSFFAAFSFALLFTTFRESMDLSISTPEQLKATTGLPVLSQLSYIETSEEKSNKVLKRILKLLIVATMIAIALYFTNKYLISLENLWQMIIDRLKMII